MYSFIGHITSLQISPRGLSIISSFYCVKFKLVTIRKKFVQYVLHTTMKFSLIFNPWMENMLIWLWLLVVIQESTIMLWSHKEILLFVKWEKDIQVRKTLHWITQLLFENSLLTWSCKVERLLGQIWAVYDIDLSRLKTDLQPRLQNWKEQN